MLGLIRPFLKDTYTFETQIVLLSEKWTLVKRQRISALSRRGTSKGSNQGESNYKRARGGEEGIKALHKNLYLTELANLLQCNSILRKSSGYFLHGDVRRKTPIKREIAAQTTNGEGGCPFRGHGPPSNKVPFGEKKETQRIAGVRG